MNISKQKFRVPMAVAVYNVCRISVNAICLVDFIQCGRLILGRLIS